MGRRRQRGGQSITAVRLALVSTVVLVASFVARGTARSLLAFIWVLLVLAALILEWSARRRSR